MPSNKLPDRQQLEDAAIEIGVDASFIEKDWHATRVLAAIVGSATEHIYPVFCGGTCLSKAHGLIKRFSEDLDFRAQFVNGTKASQGNRKRFRNAIVETVQGIEGIQYEEKSLKKAGNHFKFALGYENLFDIPGGLRRELRVEFSFTQARNPTSNIPVISLFDEIAGVDRSNGVQVNCISAIETASDKLSALVWRALKRDRDSTGDDLTMIRHLYDLSALLTPIRADAETFVRIATESFDADMHVGSRKLEMTLAGACARAIERLEVDELYEKEYETFVTNMSYGDSTTQHRFAQALANLRNLGRLIDAN